MRLAGTIFTVSVALGIFMVVPPASAEDGSSAARRYALGLTGDTRIGDLHGARRVTVEFGLEQGVQRVAARVDSVWLHAGGAILELGIAPPLDPGLTTRVRGVILRRDSGRTGAWIGGAAGTALGYLVSALWLESDTGAGGRWLRVAAVLGGGALGGVAGRRVGSAIGEDRGYPAGWMRPID